MIDTAKKYIRVFPKSAQQLLRAMLPQGSTGTAPCFTQQAPRVASNHPPSTEGLEKPQWPKPGQWFQGKTPPTDSVWKRSGRRAKLCGTLHCRTRAPRHGVTDRRFALLESTQLYFWEAYCKKWAQEMSSFSENVLSSLFFFFSQQNKQFWVREARMDPSQCFPRKPWLRCGTVKWWNCSFVWCRWILVCSKKGWVNWLFTALLVLQGPVPHLPFIQCQDYSAWLVRETPAGASAALTWTGWGGSGPLRVPVCAGRGLGEILGLFRWRCFTPYRKGPNFLRKGGTQVSSFQGQHRLSDCWIRVVPPNPCPPALTLKALQLKSCWIRSRGCWLLLPP